MDCIDKNMEGSIEVTCTTSKTKDEVRETKLLLNLFQRSEVKSIEKKQKEFEDIPQKMKTEKAYSEYQQYLLKVLRNIQSRIKQRGAENNAKMIDLQLTYVRKVNDLSVTMIDLFPESVDFLYHYTLFCSADGLVPQAMAKLEDLLDKYGDSSPRLCEAVLACYSLLGRPEELKMCIVNALRVHKDHALALKCIELPLTQAKEKRDICLAKGVEIDETDSSMTSKLAEDTYSQYILQGPKEIDQFNDILELCRAYDFAAQLENKVIKDFYLYFNHDEKVHDILIKNEIYHMKKKSNGKKLSKKQTFSVSFMYKYAVRHLNTEKMWSFYIDWLLDLIENEEVWLNWKHTLLFKTLQSAQQQIDLPEKYCLLWVEKAEARNKPKKATKILKLIREKQLRSVKLSEARLRILLKRGKFKRAMKIFRKGVEMLHKDALPLWKLLLKSEIMQKKEKEDELRALYVEGWTQPVEVSKVLRPMFLEYLASSSAGIEAARMQYRRGYKKEPYSLETHRGMFKLLTRQPTPNLGDMLNVLNCACDQFGSNSTKVWVDLLVLEMKHGPYEVRQISENAMKNLHWSLHKKFESDLRILGIWEEIYPTPLDENQNFIKVEVEEEAV